MILFLKIPDRIYYSDIEPLGFYAYTSEEHQEECRKVKKHYQGLCDEIQEQRQSAVVKLLPKNSVDVIAEEDTPVQSVPYSHDALIIVRVPGLLSDIRNKAIKHNLQAQIPNGRFLLVPKEVEVQVIC